MNTVISYERLESELHSVEAEADFFRAELESALRESERLRQALKHVVNCFPDMPLVALQTAQLAIGDVSHG